MRTGLRAAIGWLLAGMLSLASCGVQSDQSLTDLADQACARLATRIEAPAAQLPFLCLVERSLAAPLREYVLRQQAEAVQALLEAGSASSWDAPVRRLLGGLARDGRN